MAIKGVLRPGFVQLRVLDKEKALWHYRDIMGLDVVSEEADGRVYLKAYDEFDRHSVILRETDEAGMDCMGWKVESEAYLDESEVKLKALGVKTQWIAEGEQPGMGRRLRVHLPSGHLFDYYATCALSEQGPMTHNPDIYRDMPRACAVMRFDHCLLYGTSVMENFRILEEVFEYRIAEVQNGPEGDPLVIFLTISTKAHDVAFAEHPEPGKLHHASFLLEDWNAVGHAADIMTRFDIPVDIGPTRHGITRGRTIYFWDPSGNRNEVFAGGYEVYPDNPQRSWDFDQVGKAIFYYEKKLNETFLPVVT